MNDNRYFIAIPLPEHLKQQLAAWVDDCKSQCRFRRWVHPQDYHITLKFLGACTTEQLRRIHAALAQQAVDEPHMFELSIGMPGIFGDPKYPRVLWAGVEGDLSALNRLQRKVEQGVAAFGFQPERRPYRPHVTLARTFQGSSLDLDHIHASWEAKFGSDLGWRVQSLVLYKTEFRQVPMYQIIKQFEIGI